MTDKELSISDADLIARLRNYGHVGTVLEAADRIEALVKQCEGSARASAKIRACPLFITALPAVVPVVRPLVWHEGDEPDEWKSGPYDVWCELGRFQLYYWSIVMGEPHETADAAKAAGQAHHEALVRAELTVTPAPDAQAVRDAALREAVAVVMEECWKDREMKLAKRIEGRILAALDLKGN